MKFIAFFMLLLIQCYSQSAKGSEYEANSWESVKKNGKGSITIYYRDTKPYIIRDPSGDIRGIEVDIVSGFSDYLKNEYGYDVNINWIRISRFTDVYSAIKNDSINGTFAISNISYTEKRFKEVKLSPPYMHDISVMVSSQNVKVVNRESEFKEAFRNLSAITVVGTTYEKQLLDIKKRYNANFPIIYVENTNNIIENISQNDDFFGYIDLPNYLLATEELKKISRQNIFPFQNVGYCMIYPLNSDWNEAIEAYFNSSNFNVLIKKSVEKYLGIDAYDFIEKLGNSNNESLEILEREKERQSEKLSENAFILSEQRAIRNLIIVGLLATIIVLILLYNRFRVKVKANEILDKHRKEIDIQRENIKIKNDELEANNAELIVLNDEKNNLINILSHDLRAPANNIQGLVTIFKMDKQSISENQGKILSHIKSEAERLNIMIEKILDIRSLEANKKNICFEKVNLTTVAQGIIGSFSERANTKNILMNLVSDDNSISINADKIYLIQIIENLISNALKFSPKNSLITIHITKKFEKAFLEVQDEGPGITEEDRSKMFNKFQRLSARPTGGESSTGLGLSIVKKYVEEMNGKVWSKVNSNKGSTFVLEFDMYKKSRVS